MKKRNVEIINKIVFGCLFFIFILYLYSFHIYLKLGYFKSFNFKMNFLYGIEIILFGVGIFYYITKFYEEARIFLLTFIISMLPNSFYITMKQYGNNLFVINIFLLIVMISFEIFYSLRNIRNKFEYKIFLNKNEIKNKQMMRRVYLDIQIFFLSISIIMIFVLILSFFMKFPLKIKITTYQKINVSTYLILFVFSLYNTARFKKWAHCMFLSILIIILFDLFLKIVFVNKYRQLFYYIILLFLIIIIIAYNTRKIKGLFENTLNI